MLSYYQRKNPYKPRFYYINMAKDSKFIGVTIPTWLYEFIQTEMEQALFTSPSDWIRSACREYYEKRKRDRLGGGGFN